MHFLIIGGSDAGISAALRARELDARADITVLLEDEYPNFSICGLPFLLSGETPDWRSLAHRTEFPDIDIRRRHRALHIDPVAQTVEVQVNDGERVSIAYDKCLLGTGASPIWPPIHGVDLPGVYVLHTMDEGLELKQFLERSTSGRAIIIGAGYIGVEMADALRHRGFDVLLVGRAASILSTLDADLGSCVETELQAHGVKVRTGLEVQSISQTPKGLRVTGTQQFDECCDVVLIAVGVKPNAALAQEAGAALDARGAVPTDQHMRTALPHIFAAGDCAATWHRLLKRAVYLPLGTTSHKQGRIAGENAVGGDAEFAGSLGTQVVKVFERVVGRTGLRHEEAAAAGFDPFTQETDAFDHKAYYPGAKPLRVRLTGESRGGRLLGAQLVGQFGAEVSKRLDVIALALFHGMKVADLSAVDLSYTPPLGSPWDPLQSAAQAWVRAMISSASRSSVEPKSSPSS